ncbi:pilus assembly PilX family protein [Spongiibacter tropicus]|uniref:pilus assembly PilX family protein n=1 Tax=Spongiibacter tropicus TaxID=454602 RepID=UPI0035BE2C9E
MSCREVGVSATKQSQGGAVLAVSLIFTLILTVIAVSSIQVATMQERMAGNSRDASLAFQAAEAGLREGEAQLAGVNLPSFSGANGFYISCSNPNDSRTVCQEPDWQNESATGWAVLDDDTIANVARQPEYIIERMTNVVVGTRTRDFGQTVRTLDFYRVTARGYGSSGRTVVVLSTTFMRGSN